MQQSGKRLKLAVLDSGIDGQHLYFDEEDRIVDGKSWVPGAARQDSSGHGTHVAGLVLDLTRNVDIYVARITATKILTDVEAIADVSSSWIPPKGRSQILTSASGYSTCQGRMAGRHDNLLVRSQR